jgi:hypothetical protein
LLTPFDIDVNIDLGLDAVDVIDADGFLVAFSTELDSPNNAPAVVQFKAGDLLTTSGVVIPNQALTYAWGQGAIQHDLGLDAVQFMGEPNNIIAFLGAAADYDRDDWLRTPDLLVSLLGEYGIDIWFSTEGTARIVGGPQFLDGDALSALIGMIAPNKDLLPTTVPAGIPDRGVDFGLDALTNARTGDETFIHFSTEILYEGEFSFTDGDLLEFNNNIIAATNEDLVGCFEPKAMMLGLDALYLGNIQTDLIYLPVTAK